MSISIADTKKSLANFGNHFSELTDEGLVNLDTHSQVEFFLQFLELFKVDKTQISIYGYQCVDVDVDDYDYETGRYSYSVSDTEEGYLIVLGEMSEEQVLEISGVDNADDYTLELETETFITVGGE